jgi:hypothetical protein
MTVHRARDAVRESCERAKIDKPTKHGLRAFASFPAAYVDKAT